jgi:sulfur carrier protein
MIQIEVNGKIEHTEQLIIIDFIKQKGLKKDGVIIELNGAILTKDLWEKTKLNSGDKIEIVRFVGGG